MLKVGLTGGIGSGKSTVAKIFEVLGIPVYYADDAAKRMMNSNEPLKEKIIRHFGRNAYREGSLDRGWLAAEVFSDNQKLELLNSLVHPVTISDAEDWMRRQNAPYAIKEAALLFESAAAAGLDLIIGVNAPTHLRINRIMERDGVSREKVIQRMESQLEEDIKMKLCDFVIVNDEQSLLVPQVLQLHDRLMNKV